MVVAVLTTVITVLECTIFVVAVPTCHRYDRCHGLRVYPVCVCNTVRLGQVRSRHNLKPSGTRFECVSGLSV